MSKRHKRKGSTCLTIRETQMKTILRFHLTPVRMVKSKPPGTVYVGEDVGKDPPPLLVGVQSHKATLQISRAIPQENSNQSTKRSSNSALRHIAKYADLYNQDICSIMFIVVLFLIARS